MNLNKKDHNNQYFLFSWVYQIFVEIDKKYTSTSTMFLFTIVGSSHTFQAILFVTFQAIDTFQASINKTTNPNVVTNFELSHLKKIDVKSFLDTELHVKSPFQHTYELAQNVHEVQF